MLSRRWNTSSWFAGADGLQDATVAAAAVAPGGQPPAASQPQEADTLTVVGGAKAQSRFSGKTAIPIATVTPLSIASLAKPSGAAPAQQQPSGGSSLPAAARHEAWSSTRVAERTVDGSVPPSADGGNGVGTGGPHRSRYVFDTRNWRWVHSESAGQAAGSSDKHQLAARRWGDRRDSLAAAAALQQQQQQVGGNADAVAAAPAAPSPSAAPAKRQRLPVSAMTGDSSDAGFAAVGGLQKQREALVEQVVYPLAHPRLFSRLGVSAARGMLLHGPPGT
jgi:transitional endoplasmic reticulum ATPase